MDRYIDLHLHTSYSDGKVAPEPLLKKIRKSRLAAFSITDHDTIEGLRVTQELLDEECPELVNGIELSTEFKGNDLHILGYLFDPDNQPLNDLCRKLQKRRNNRAKEMVKKLAELGLEISFESVMEAAGEGSVGRPHVADALYKHRLTSTYLEAFQKYIATDGPAYVPKTKISPKEAIEIIHGAGGLAILAHPMIDNAIHHIDKLVEIGIDGMEMYHCTASRKARQMIKREAEKFGLVLSGGSDYHGRDSRHDVIDRSRVPYEFLEAMKTRHQKTRGDV